MTDKQIIIDGVPVQDCCYFDYENDGYKDSCYIHQNECSAQNCYYKQLKRKEQECEELQERAASIIYSLTGGRLSYSTYTLEGCEQAYHDQLEIDVERATKELQEENETLKQEVNKYKQALDEIKMIAEENIRIADLEGLNGVYRRGLAKQILQKISEYKGEYNEKIR